jgi:hypothetical protein
MLSLSSQPAYASLSHSQCQSVCATSQSNFSSRADGLLLDRSSSLLAESLSSAGILGIAELRTRSESTTVPEVLDHAGFESLVHYSDDGSFGVWLAMKDINARSFWFGRSQAETERDMRLRLSAVSLSSLRVIDSPGIMRYKFPTRISEAIWCGQHGYECTSGHGYNPHIPNVPISSIYVKHSGMGDKAGRGLFARLPIRQGSRIGMEMCVHNMYVPPPMYSLLTAMHRQIGRLWKPFLGYIRWYGWIDTNYVSSVQPTRAVFAFNPNVNDSQSKAAIDCVTGSTQPQCGS